MKRIGMIILFITMVLMLPLSGQAQPPQAPPPAGPIGELQSQVQDLQEQINNIVIPVVDCPCWTEDYLNENAYDIGGIPLCIDGEQSVVLAQHDYQNPYLVVVTAYGIVDSPRYCYVEGFATPNGGQLNIDAVVLTQGEADACREILRNSQMWTLNCE